MILHGVVNLSKRVHPGVVRVLGVHELDFHGCELVFQGEYLGPHLVVERHFDRKALFSVRARLVY